MDRARIVDRLKELTVEAVQLAEEATDEELVVAPDTFLPDLMDSIGLSTLLSLAESEWGIAFQEEEIQAEMFENLTALAAAIEAKLPATT